MQMCDEAQGRSRKETLVVKNPENLVGLLKNRRASYCIFENIRYTMNWMTTA
jgi:hypothetical protein